MKNIFVGNLDFAANEDSIRQLFEAYGAVQRVNLIVDRDTGRARGFGFVEMEDATAADRAIDELDGRQVGGRAIKVNEAKPREGGGGARSGGGGGYARQRREPRW